MLLSIIVPVYNVEKFLARCLDSLIDQDLEPANYEIIVVNDGSPDGSLAIAERYASAHPNVRIVSQVNQGLSEARNAGLRVANGTYVYFIDSDDYVQPQVFGKLLALQVAHDLDFLGFGTTNTPKDDYRADVDFKPYQQSLDVYSGVDFIGKHNYLANAWWYIIKKEVLDQSGLIFEKGRMLEDGMYTAELLLNSRRTAFVKLDIYRYFLNLASLTTTTYKKNSDRMNNDSKFVIHKFTGLIQLAQSKNAGPDALRRLRTIQESYLFFLILRMVKGGVPFAAFSDLLAEMKAIGIWPMRHFFGVDYQSNTERTLTVIFNNKFLLRLLLKTNSVLKVIK